MSYVEKTLLEDETIFYRARLHWFRYVSGVGLLLTGLVLTDFGSAYARYPLFGILSIMLGLIFVFKAWLDGITSEFVVTSSRVLIKYGFIWRHL